MSATPGELYQDPALKAELANYWHSSVPIEDFLPSLDPVAEEADVVGYMNRLEDEDKETWHKARTAIALLPSEAIVENYGRETLLWAAANSVMTMYGGKHTDALKDLAGYDPILLEKSRLWCWQREHTARGRNILAQYMVASTVIEGGLDEVDLPQLLRKYAKSGVKVDDARAAEYELFPVTINTTAPPSRAVGLPEKTQPHEEFDVWLDTISGAVLAYKGRPNAIIGVAAAGSDEIMIHQLQGLRGELVDPTKPKYDKDHVIGKVATRGLARLDWRGLMVGVAEQLARNMHMRAVGIQAGEKNYWANKTVWNETKPRLTKESAALVYDVPARRLGYTRGADGNWHKPLSPD